MELDNFNKKKFNRKANYKKLLEMIIRKMI